MNKEQDKKEYNTPKEIIEIPIHFDLKDNQHYIPIDDFLSFSYDIKNIIDEFSNVIFKDSFQYIVVVLPPEEGSFLKKIGIIPLTIGSFALGAGFGNGLVEGLTGHKLEYYGKNTGLVIKEVAVNFLEKDEKDIENLRLDNQKLISSKNNFYEKCIENNIYNGVEFSEIFSNKKITRDNFLSKVNKKNDEPFSDYKIHELIVVSPVNIKNKTQQWKTKDKKTGELLNFFMEDKEFLINYLNGKYPLKERVDDDVMIVMVEYRKKTENGVEKIIKRSAVKVYKINDEVFDKVPEDKSIEGVLASVDKIENNVSEEQDTLFNLLNDNQE